MITDSTKILTLAVAPFLSVSGGILCEFAMLSHMYIFCLLRKKGTDVHNLQHIHQQNCTPQCFFYHASTYSLVPN